MLYAQDPEAANYRPGSALPAFEPTGHKPAEGSFPSGSRQAGLSGVGVVRKEENQQMKQHLTGFYALHVHVFVFFEGFSDCVLQAWQISCFNL